MPYISIVLPSYNGEKYIGEAIDSILNQSYTDWELIIVDDCSNDNTLQIANEYAALDDRIKIIHNSNNKKLPEALNIGFRHAMGQYLTWTSDDNILKTEALKRLSDYLDTHAESIMVCADMDTYNIETGDNSHYIEYDPNAMYLYDVVGACFMYRREVLDEIGEYDTTLFCAEDYDYWIRILKKYGEIGHLNETLYLYRYHSGTLTDTKLPLVRKRTAQLLWKHRDWVFGGISGDLNLVLQFYYQMLRGDNLTDEVKEKIFEFIPELEWNTFPNEELPWIVFGAGKIGSKVFNEFKYKVSYFSDSNPTLWGNTKEGINILSLEEMADRASEYQIIVASGTSKQPSMMRTLYDLNIRQFSTFETVQYFYESH